MMVGGLFQLNYLMDGTGETIAIHYSIVDEKNCSLGTDRGRPDRQGYELRRIPSLEAAKVNIRERISSRKEHNSRHFIVPALDASDAF